MTTRLQLSIVIVLILASLVLARQASARRSSARDLDGDPSAATPTKVQPSTPAVRAAIGRIMTAVHAQSNPNLCGFEVPAQLFAHFR